MSEMVERVARAICDRLNPAGVDCTCNPETCLSPTMNEFAQAAISRMREPTGEMIDAGAETYGVGTGFIGQPPTGVLNGQPRKAYRAMIDAALKNLSHRPP